MTHHKTVAPVVLASWGIHYVVEQLQETLINCYCLFCYRTSNLSNRGAPSSPVKICQRLGLIRNWLGYSPTPPLILQWQKVFKIVHFRSQFLSHRRFENWYRILILKRFTKCARLANLLTNFWYSWIHCRFWENSSTHAGPQKRAKGKVCWIINNSDRYGLKIWSMCDARLFQLPVQPVGIPWKGRRVARTAARSQGC